MFKKYFIFVSKTVCCLLFVWLISLIFNCWPLPAQFLTSPADMSITVMSRDGQIMRQTLAGRGGRRSKVQIDEVNSAFIDLLVFTEDKYFYVHPGINPLAIGRATLQYVRQGRIVSGASTISMQVARLMHAGARRTLANKIIEMFWAIYLETALSKTQILEMYLNHLPFSNEIYGVAEASQVYFKKKAQDLSLPEAAYLLGIIRAPSFYNPYKNSQGLFLLKNRILRSYLGARQSLKNEATLLLNEKINVFAREVQFKAPHFSDYVLSQKLEGFEPQVKTSLDLQLNENIQQLVQQHLVDLQTKNVNQASVLVVKNKTAEILAYVGSQNYWDSKFQGMIDGVQQKRQPGSALKPFTYARALDLGIEPAHVLPDVAVAFKSDVGNYMPENYNRKFSGPVSMRTALANSLNVPAVQLLREIGVIQLYQILKELEFSQLDENPNHYGLGLTLGNVETSLFELVRAYSVFARQGQYCDLNWQLTETDCIENSKTKKIFSKQSVAVIQDFLTDNHARHMSFGVAGPLEFDFPILVKTGTSQNYRDNWTVAVTPEYTIGVWAGNFNGDPMLDVSGVTGAAPILHAVVDEIYKRQEWVGWHDLQKPVKQKICALSGMRPQSFCPHTKMEFVSEGDESLCKFHQQLTLDQRNGFLAGPQCQAPVRRLRTFVNLPNLYRKWQSEFAPQTLAPQVYSAYCPAFNQTQARVSAENSFQILSPEDGATYQLDRHRPLAAQVLVLKTTNQNLDFKIYYDERLISKQEAQTLKLEYGKHRLQVVEAGRVLDEIEFKVR